MATKLDRVVTYYQGLLTIKSHEPFILWQKPLYLFYQSAHDYQTWKDGDIPWGAANQKIIWCFDHMILQGHVSNENRYISTTS